MPHVVAFRLHLLAEIPSRCGIILSSRLLRSAAMKISSTQFTAVSRLASSLLGPYVEPYIIRLEERGYPPTTIQNQLRRMLKLSRWLTRTGRDLGDLNEEALDRFWRHRTGGQKRKSAAPALEVFLAVLRAARVTPPAVAPARTPAQLLADRYRRYLVEERGLSHLTVDSYGRNIERFVTHHFGVGAAATSRIQVRDVVGYVLHNTRTHTPQQTKSVVSALRSFFRFLLYQGLIRMDLASVVPAVAHWRMTGLPKHLPAKAVQKVLDRCEQTTPVERRNYAILLLLARLGLRAGEIVALRLEDIDWENAHITIRSKKGRGWVRMPLPTEVGRALARYLRYGRPASPCCNVFIRSVAPYGPLSASANIACLTRSALERAGVESGRKGAHLFRHSLATAMLRQGASLDEIGQVLRHQDPNTTALYAKVDLDALRRLARPWPGGVR
jgi:site-specific recombinase XerD